MLITFEGPEGCGKSTQAKKLKEYLQELGKEVVLTHEPGGTEFGKKIRQLLLFPEVTLEKKTELLLFAADRQEHVAKIIKPALTEGKIVICDRYSDSTLAYQVAGQALPEDLVRYTNMVAADGLEPNLTFLLDVSPEVGLQRAAQAGVKDRFESEKIIFHQRVREKFLQLAQNNRDRIKILDSGKNDIERLRKEIRGIIDEKLGNKK